MSEYQYYQWQTMDRLLTPAEQAQVKGLSSHIAVSASSAWVEYNWGDFKHDPKQVLARYFDAFMYFANWGSQRLAFRFPKDLLDARALQPYLLKYGVTLEAVSAYVVLDINLLSEDGGNWQEREGDLSVMAELRQDILGGDTRLLYLAWLSTAGTADVREETPEPPVPAGLNELIPALTEFCRFFELDEHLIQAAAESSPALRPPAGLPLAEAIGRLTPAERDSFLLRLAQGDAHVALALNQRLQQLAGTKTQTPAPSQRTWGQLRQRATALGEEAKQKVREEAERKRVADLDALAPQAEQTWRDAEALIEQKQVRAYDEAVALLRQLHELALYQGKLPEFATRLAILRQRNVKRPSLMDRLQKAHLD